MACCIDTEDPGFACIAEDYLKVLNKRLDEIDKEKKSMLKQIEEIRQRYRLKS